MLSALAVAVVTLPEAVAGNSFVCPNNTTLNIETLTEDLLCKGVTRDFWGMGWDYGPESYQNVKDFLGCVVKGTETDTAVYQLCRPAPISALGTAGLLAWNIARGIYKFFSDIPDALMTITEAAATGDTHRCAQDLSDPTNAGKWHANVANCKKQHLGGEDNPAQKTLWRTEQPITDVIWAGLRAVCDNKDCTHSWCKDGVTRAFDATDRDCKKAIAHEKRVLTTYQEWTDIETRFTKQGKEAGMVRNCPCAGLKCREMMIAKPTSFWKLRKHKITTTHGKASVDTAGEKRSKPELVQGEVGYCFNGPRGVIEKFTGKDNEALPFCTGDDLLVNGFRCLKPQTQESVEMPTYSGGAGSEAPKKGESAVLEPTCLFYLQAQAWIKGYKEGLNEGLGDECTCKDKQMRRTDHKTPLEFQTYCRVYPENTPSKMINGFLEGIFKEVGEKLVENDLGFKMPPLGWSFHGCEVQDPKPKTL